MIKNEQRKKIFAECRARGIDDELRHEIVKNVTGKTSIKELTSFEASLVIERICGKKGNQQQRRIRTDAGGDPRTVNMRRKIYKLEQDLGWQDNPNRLKGHMKKMRIYSEVNFLTPHQCFQLIESLKAVAKRQGIEVDY